MKFQTILLSLILIPMLAACSAKDEAAMAEAAVRAEEAVRAEAVRAAAERVKREKMEALTLKLAFEIRGNHGNVDRDLLSDCVKQAFQDGGADDEELEFISSLCYSGAQIRDGFNELRP